MENSKDMAQHTYDNEAVQELLNWAKKMIETKNYPTERYQVNQCTTIIDGNIELDKLASFDFNTVPAKPVTGYKII